MLKLVIVVNDCIFENHNEKKSLIKGLKPTRSNSVLCSK